MSQGLLLAGRYRLIEQLGSGGMAAVWRAEDMNLGAEVAIKLIDNSLASSPDALARFRREAHAAASIRSTYVVQILDYGVSEGTPFIAMELLKGESLARRLEAVGRLSPPQTAQILGHVGRALSLAHDHGIVHRDLKPENIFLVSEGNQDVGKLLDFGIAGQTNVFAESGGPKTQVGTILGTPYYMSPEQASGMAVDASADIWAFGAIAFECLIGRQAFFGDTLGGIFHSVCVAPIAQPSQCGTVPPGFDAWFFRAVSRDKGLRFDTIKEATDKLQELCGTVTDSASVVRLPVGVRQSPVSARTNIGLSVTLSDDSARSASKEKRSKRGSRYAALGGLFALVLVTVAWAGGWYQGAARVHSPAVRAEDPVQVPPPRMLQPSSSKDPVVKAAEPPTTLSAPPAPSTPLSGAPAGIASAAPNKVSLPAKSVVAQGNRLAKAQAKKAGRSRNIAGF